MNHKTGGRIERGNFNNKIDCVSNNKLIIIIVYKLKSGLMRIDRRRVARFLAKDAHLNQMYIVILIKIGPKIEGMKQVNLRFVKKLK